jgi:hypothetical protein
MRRYIVPALIVANVALAGGLAWMWVAPDGQLRDVRWTPPAPIKPVLTDAPFPPWTADIGSFMASLDRPLFSATRKPPPKPSEAPPVVVDTLASVRILGLYSTDAKSGGAVVRHDGKVVRLKLGDTLGGWTVKEVRPVGLVLTRGAEERTIEVKMGPDLAADAPAAPGGRAAAGNQNAAPTNEQQRVERDAANSKAAVNALRARAGMPPLP